MMYENHKGSVGSMESSGAVKIFQRSIKNQKFRFNNYIEDGDSNSFNKVVQSKPYGKTFRMSPSYVAVNLQRQKIIRW